jgi:hypothetical protein
VNCSLTRDFAQRAEGQGSLEFDGTESWQRVLSLLRAATSLRTNPIAPMQNFIARWIRNFENKNTRESGVAIYHIFDDFSRERYCPPKILLTPMVEEATRVAHVISVKEMRKLLISLAYLAIDPGEVFLSAMNDNIRAQYGLLNKNEAIFLLHGLAVMDSVLSHHSGDERYDLRSIYDFLVSRPDFLDKIRESPDSAQINMLADADRWFLGKSEWKYQEDRFQSSPLEGKVAGMLRRCNADVFEQMDMPYINHPVDLSVIYNEKSFHLECDGSTHLVHLCNKQDSYMSGQTIFQSGLIQRAVDAPLVRLPSYIFGKNAHNKGYWKSFLDQMTGIPEKTSLMLLGVGQPRLLPIKVTYPF